MDRTDLILAAIIAGLRAMADCLEKAVCKGDVPALENPHKNFRSDPEDVDADYDDSIKAMEEENARREEASKSEEPKYTIDDVRNCLAEKAREGMKDKVKELIKSFGADRVSNISPDKYADVIAAASKLKVEEA